MHVECCRASRAPRRYDHIALHASSETAIDLALHHYLWATTLGMLVEEPTSADRKSSDSQAKSFKGVNQIVSRPARDGLQTHGEF